MADCVQDEVMEWSIDLLSKIGILYRLLCYCDELRVTGRWNWILIQILVEQMALKNINKLILLNGYHLKGRTY